MFQINVAQFKREKVYFFFAIKDVLIYWEEALLQQRNNVPNTRVNPNPFFELYLSHIFHSTMHVLGSYAPTDRINGYQHM